MRELEYTGQSVLDLMRASGLERDIALFRACADVIKSLDRYAPPRFVEPVTLTHEQRNWVLSLQNHRELDQLRTAVAADPFAFGTYRSAVFDHEGERSRRLQVLVWVAQELSRLRDKPTAQIDRLDALAERVSQCLWDAWGVQQFPLEGAYRDWATRVGRRYDLCPRLWRAV